MMLTSKPIKDKAALKLGLIDGIFPEDQLLGAARKLALEIAAGAKPRNLSLYRYIKVLCCMARSACARRNSKSPQAREFSKQLSCNA